MGYNREADDDETSEILLDFGSLESTVRVIHDYL
jgi:hypothetical protein